ncbi:MAG: 2-oxo acid dehydrogenase subunit E2, partial [Gammaproteobacteria bacterium]
GYKDRITHEDVKRFVKSALRGGAAVAGGALPAVPEVDYARFGEVETKPLSRIKRISGPRLQAAWINAPRVTQHDDADITALERVRKAMNEDAGEGGVKITPLAFLVRAVVLAMKAYPDANSALDGTGENLIVRRYFHIGFAVDTEEGLVVPVIRDADRKGIRDIAAELAALADKARGGKLKRKEIEGGCFSITSLGSIGGTSFTPIVNAPEVAILGVSRAEMKPKWNGQVFEPRLMLPLSLSYDHRVIDGATAVRITRHLARTLETLRGFVS